jgi:hypothetical protein
LESDWARSASESGPRCSTLRAAEVVHGTSRIIADGRSSQDGRGNSNNKDMARLHRHKISSRYKCEAFHCCTSRACRAYPAGAIHRRLETRRLKPARPGDVIQPAGIIKAKQTTHKSRWVLIDVVVRNQNDEKVAAGEGDGRVSGHREGELDAQVSGHRSYLAER